MFAALYDDLTGTFVRNPSPHAGADVPVRRGISVMAQLKRNIYHSYERQISKPKCSRNPRRLLSS